jgi:hypothetical protein
MHHLIQSSCRHSCIDLVTQPPPSLLTMRRSGASPQRMQEQCLYSTHHPIRSTQPLSLPRLSRAARSRPRGPSIQPRSSSPSPSSFHRWWVDLLLPAFDPPQRRCRVPRPLHSFGPRPPQPPCAPSGPRPSDPALLLRQANPARPGPLHQASPIRLWPRSRLQGSLHTDPTSTWRPLRPTMSSSSLQPLPALLQPPRLRASPPFMLSPPPPVSTSWVPS